MVTRFSHKSHTMNDKFSTNGVSVASNRCRNPRCENTVSDTSHTYHIFIRWMRSVYGTYPRSHTILVSGNYSHTLEVFFSDRFQLFFMKGFEESCGKAKVLVLQHVKNTNLQSTYNNTTALWNVNINANSRVAMGSLLK